ncbi:MAG: hypothetical protein QM756_45350 [Polyangiaceae bacterium]
MSADTVHPEYAQVESDFASPATAQALASLNTDERDQLHEYWVARADGELTTALSFEYVLEDLRKLNAPGEFTSLAERAIADEHRHVDWCLRWARAVDAERDASAKFGGTRPLTFSGASERDHLLLRTVFGCCFSETVAVHVLRASHALIQLDSVKRLNHRHLSEEMGHARLGWALVAWPALGQRERDMLRAHVPEMLSLTREAWTSSQRAATDRLHQLGYLSTPLVKAACDEAIEQVVLPGLAHVGILPRG